MSGNTDFQIRREATRQDAFDEAMRAAKGTYVKATQPALEAYMKNKQSAEEIYPARISRERR